MSSSPETTAAVRRMQDYIEEHLGEPVTLAQLARSARYSPWHAARLFKELTGRTPFEYLRLRRLTAAAERMRGGDAGRIIDVAFDFVFDSHAGFTRAFTRQFGVAPARFRKDRNPLELFMPPRLAAGEARGRQGEFPMTEPRNVRTVFVQVVERPARKLVLRRGRQATHYFEYCAEVGCEVWEQLVAITPALHEPMGLWLPETLRPAGTSTYVQGVEVATDFAGALPPGFEIVELPPCQLMVFQGPPFADDEFEQAIGDLWAEIDRYRPENYGFSWAEQDAPRFQLQPLGYRGYIEGRPVRRINV